MIRKIIARVAFVVGVVLWVAALAGWVQYLLGTTSQLSIYYTLWYMLFGALAYVVAYAASRGGDSEAAVTT